MAASGLIKTPSLARKDKKRRARSSSPTSPPASLRTPASNAKQSMRDFETPRGDPAAELWDRLSLPVAGTSPSTAVNPLLARVMVSSSPRTPGSERSLRKAVSCGSNWPRAKRRRIDPSELDQLGVSLAERTSKSSLVTDLLEAVDGEIMRSERPSEGKESTTGSPSRKPPPREARSDTRPSSGKQQDVPSPRSNCVAEVVDLTAGSPEKPSSDYGDEAFDEDTLMELEASIVNLGQADDLTLIDDDPVPPPVTTLSKTDEEDEFGDLDDDLFEDAEELMAVADPRQTQPPSVKKSVDDDLDDEFGDGFGDDVDLDALELAATQSATQVPKRVRPRASSLHVGSLNFG